MVLVVDDNEQLRYFIQSSLQPYYRVLMAANREAGLQTATAELLLHGEAVSGAAYATGFSKPSYFSQCFKEMFGQSPAQ